MEDGVAPLEFRVLGPLEVLESGEPRPLTASKQRALLAALLLQPNEVVSADRLLEALWGERPPARAQAALRVYVAELRKVLGKDRLETCPPGYVLRVGDDELDLARFERLVELAGSNGAQRSLAPLTAALALWRGPPLRDLADDALAQAEAARLEELRLHALEQRIDAELALGKDSELVGELESIVRQEPLRERPRAQLMLALYRAGRQAEALDVYRQARRILVDELGIEPGSELKELERRILAHDPTLKHAARDATVSPPTPSRERRKTVTVLFCDITGSTELGEATDPEVLRARLARYFERMKAIVESHGGSVEKFIGDAVMAVFGVPRVHEDDALRAARAAVEMRDALPELGVDARFGVNSGEVVTGTEERLVTGDAVNVAARLEQVAEPGEILIGRTTRALLRDAVEAEAVEPLALKGKEEPVSAFRLLSVRGEPSRRHGVPMVGRERELEALNEAFARTRQERSCELFTVVGSAGVGKSRLAHEFLQAVDARVVRGRCLAYGEGITYWPLVEVLKQLDALPSDPAAATALRSVLRETDAATSADEIAWGFRKLLEEQAEAAPLVSLLDDIQWAEQTFLDLLEQVALLSTGAPILLLCLARPELAERRPEWPIPLRLEPLPDGAVEELIPSSLADDMREKIRRASGGNPLFINEMVELAAAGEGEITVPPTLQAVLAERLDQLDADERSVLERGAVEGEIFHRGAVQALSGESAVIPRLASLVRKGLIRPDKPQLPGDDAFRFRHILFRDAAYDGLPKSERADLHERFAAWLEEKGANLVELDELLGYHLEQAALYRRELGREGARIAENASERLASAGHRARHRGDMRATLALLERALALRRPLRLDVALELDLADAQQTNRGDVEMADEVARRARENGDAVGELVARAWAAVGRNAIDEADVLSREGLRVVQADAHALLFRLWNIRAFVGNGRWQYAEMARAAKKARRHAVLSGLPDGLYWLSFALVQGPVPADEALATLDTFRLDLERPMATLHRASLLAMLGRFDEASAAAFSAAERARDMGASSLPLNASLAELATLSGDHEAAVERLRLVCEYLETEEERHLLAGYTPRLARSLCALERYAEAEPLALLGRDLGDDADIAQQLWWRQAQAKVLAHRGEHEAAQSLAREAVEIAATTDVLNGQGDTLLDFGGVLEVAGRRHEAAAALEQALERYRRKKNLAMVAQVEPRLAALRG